MQINDLESEELLAEIMDSPLKSISPLYKSPRLLAGQTIEFVE